MAYAGHPREAGFGLVDMNARYYSPRLGRFLSPDPVIARPLERRDGVEVKGKGVLTTWTLDPARVDA